jgi:lactase-phlorizin hydrolase
LINELILHVITPVVTLYHWDLPQPLEDIGVCLNEEVASHFLDFATLAFEKFGDRVQTWITFNEPWVVCWQGYGNAGKAPGNVENPGVNPYLCGHNLLKAHALTYTTYDWTYRKTQGGRIGITLDSNWYEPGSQSQADIVAAERAVQFHHGWFAAPIYTGKYPKAMRDIIDRKSLVDEGLPESRLPEFDVGWSFLLKGSTDFLGLNHYTTNMVNASIETKPGWLWDQDTKTWQDPSWPASASKWLKVVPWGFRKLLNWIKNTYGNPNVLITENGFSDDHSVGTADVKRTQYYNDYINNMLKAVVVDGCNVTSYTAWSLMDNFEWMRGYSERFGVHFVDFEDQNRPRTPKDSTKLLKQIFADNGFVERVSGIPLE